MADAWRWMPMALCVRTLRRALLVLLTAWVLVQTVGVLHRVAHLHSRDAVVASAVGALGDSAGAETRSTIFKRLWGEHSSWTDCELFDQACPDVWHTTPAVVLALPAPPSWARVAYQARLAQFERFYAARGPPVDALT